MNPRRRLSDICWEREYWRQPVTRQNLVIGFMITSAMFAGVLAYALVVQDTVRDNQCQVLNRLAETKLVLRDLIDTADPPRSKRQAASFRVKKAQLSEGIVVLEHDVRQLPGNCALFRSLERRQRHGEPSLAETNRHP